jgi:probable rRNA maturation factor
MTYHIDIQHACNEEVPVTDNTLTQWATLAIKTECTSGELTLRIVDATEITQLNHQYRKQNKATNVLAFPANLPTDVSLEFPLLGDIIICPAVLQEECISLQIPLTMHWAHIVIHGVLHLLGYDHVQEEDAMVMQALEIELLAQLGFDSPYSENIEDTAIE